MRCGNWLQFCCGSFGKMVELKKVGRPPLETARRVVFSARLNNEQAKAIKSLGGAKWLREFLNNMELKK